MAEPDEDIRAELQALLEGPDEEVARRFEGQLMFGTAGLPSPSVRARCG